MRRFGIHLVSCLCFGLLLQAGCRREESPVSGQPTPGAKPEALIQTNHSASGPAAPAASRTFSVPFRGIIKAKEQRDLLLNTTQITYTIGDRKIRRDAVRTAPLGKVADLGQGSMGILCDLPADRVLLYRGDGAKKGFVSMTVKKFQALATASGIASPGTRTQPLSFLSVRPAAWKHAGTFFADFPFADAEVANAPDARMVGDLPCDLYTARARDLLLEVSHCQRIKVERELLVLVELGLPTEVTGFPLLMRRLQLVPVPPADQNATKTRQLLQKGAQWAAGMAEKAMQRGFELLDISEQAPPDSAFTLDESYVECPNLEELDRQFQPPEGHHDDWD